MRLWIDVREACAERKTGKGQWTLRCVTALLARSDVRATLLTDRAIPAEWKHLPGFERESRIAGPGMAWHARAAWAAWRARDSFDAYVAPTSFIVPYLVGGSVPTVPVIHDLIAFKHEPHDRKATMIERFALPRVARTAKALCCVSRATADAVTKRFAPTPPLVVVGAGPSVDEVGTWVGGGNHVLCIGTLNPRKNQLRLIRAYASLPDAVRNGIRLVLVGGRGWNDDAIVRAAGETPGVEWLGFRSSAECAALLRTCRAFAWVSEDEGFGIPLLDALRVGAPVLASDIPVHREVAGDCATYVDPLDVASIARGLHAVPTGRNERGMERASAFTWERAASAIASACAGIDKTA